MLIAGVGFVILFAMLFSGIPIAFGMIIVGTAGFAFLSGWAPSLAMAGQTAFDTVLNYEFSVLPLPSLRASRNSALRSLVFT